MSDRIGLGKSIGLVLAGMAITLMLGGVVAAWILSSGDRVDGDVKKSLHSPTGGDLTATLVRYESWKNILYRVYIKRDHEESSYMIFQISPGLEGGADIVWQGRDRLLIRVNCGDIDRYWNMFDHTFIGLEGNRPCQKHPSHITNS